MSNTAQINCPQCNFLIDVEEALGNRAEEKIKKEYEVKMAESFAEIHKKQQEIKEEQEKFAKAKQNENALFAERLENELKKQKQSLESEAAQKAKESFELIVKNLSEEVEQKKKENTALREKEIEMLKLEQTMKAQQEDFDLMLQKKLLENQLKVEEETKRKEAEKQELKNKEWEHQFEQQKKLIEEMRRKAEQGSMQLQGEVQEIALEMLLRQAFPFDHIGEVGKGVKGADTIQTVFNNYQHDCGKIIYESKRTKEFSQDWIDKLKQDMRNTGAAVAVLVTQTMPRDMDRFGMKDGVWICNFHEVKSLVYVLRDSLIKLQQANQTQENKGDKMQMLYTYLTGTEFRQQVEAIVEGFSSMQNSLIKEKRAMESIWKEREKQIEKVIQNTIAMYGSVKGIAGNAVGTIQSLELPE